MKKVLITGANKGIGFEVAKQMAQLGYFVYLGCRDEQKGNEAVQRIKEAGFTNIDFLKIDVSDPASVKAAASALASKAEALDILINNAGIAGKLSQTILGSDVSIFKEVFDTNYFGVIQTTQQFLPLLRKARVPVIVNVSSELGSLSMQTHVNRNSNWNNYHAYSPAKTALNTFTILLNYELKDTNFKINSVTPGYTATDLNGFAGFKTAAQGAEPIVKLATIGEDGPTGKFFSADGEVAW